MVKKNKMNITPVKTKYLSISILTIRILDVAFEEIGRRMILSCVVIFEAPHQ